ncbi:MAG: dipicolinate synthase subunit B, partial [Eubacteriales bacterium]
MKFEGIRIGFGLTGSHCTLAKTVKAMRELVDLGAEIIPIVSYAVNDMNTRFGQAEEWNKVIKEITGKEPIITIPQAEPIGPGKLLDCMVVAPCTGNTLAKMANGICDTPVLMATKAHLRNLRPLVIGVSTNDGLGISARNIGTLLMAKNIYFVPFGQDSPVQKENSLVAHMEKIPQTVKEAMEGKQIQPV